MSPLDVTQTSNDDNNDDDDDDKDDNDDEVLPCFDLPGSL